MTESTQPTPEQPEVEAHADSVLELQELNTNDPQPEEGVATESTYSVAFCTHVVTTG